MVFEANFRELEAKNQNQKRKISDVLDKLSNI